MNLLYPKAKQKFLSGEISLTNDQIRVLLIDTNLYSFNPATEFVSELPSGSLVAISDPLSNKSVINGVFDAADAVFLSVSGNQSEAIVVYKNTGNPATSPLILFVDEGAGFPITPDGTDVIVQFNNGSSRIFAI